MTEYIEREKAFDAVFGQFCASSDETESALNAAIDEIKAIPAADVRPVVYCKDCVHYIHGKLFGDIVCDYHYLHQYHAEPNDYCSHGEKREES